MHLLAALAWPALLLLATLPSAVLGAENIDYSQLTTEGYNQRVMYCLRQGNVQGLHTLFKYQPSHIRTKFTANALARFPRSTDCPGLTRYILCQNQKTVNPLTSKRSIDVLITCIRKCHYEDSKLLLCHPVVPSITAIKMIESCETSIPYNGGGGDEAQHKERRKFIRFCTRWSSLIFQCRDGKTALLDRYAPGQLDDYMVNLLLDATLLGCQRHVTRRLAALLLGRYERASMAGLKAAHEAAEANGHIHVAAFLRMLGKARMRVESASTQAFGLPELTPHIQNVVPDFTCQHHQLYEEWHGGPHQKDVERASRQNRRRKSI